MSGQGCARGTPGALCLPLPSQGRPGCLRPWQERDKWEKSLVRQEPQLGRVTVPVGDKKV